MKGNRKAPAGAAYVTVHSVKMEGRLYPPGSDLTLTDQAEIDRLVGRGAIIARNGDRKGQGARIATLPVNDNRREP